MPISRPLLLSSALLAAALLGRSEAFGAAQAGRSAAGWDAAGAARYLDGRLQWWRTWPKAERDHGTRCISCHTALPVALARPMLRQALGERAITANEQAMYADIEKRVAMWRDVEPFYTDQRQGLPKSSESRAVEAVLNALFLATRDADMTGHLSPVTRQAFTNLWPLQMQAGDLKGGFAWLNFKYEPFESETATYWGAALAAIAVARAPDDYAATPEIATNLAGLRAYLRTAYERPSSLFSRMLVLWADSQMPGVLEPAQRQKTIDELIAAQGADGGWSLTRITSWQRRDGSIIADESDGLATAMIVMALQEAGIAPGSKTVAAGRKWLIAHQNAQSGGLPATSPNKLREASADGYLFMTDAATGFATLALMDVPARKR